MSDKETSRFDEFYLKEDHATEPKEYFKYGYGLLAPLIGSNTRFLDIGCAGGDFLRHVSGQKPEAQYFGLDAFPELVAESQRRVPQAEIFEGDMNADKLELDAAPFDIVTMLGVLSIFSSENWISNFASMIAPGGTGMIFGMVNPYPYDVFVNLRNAQGTYEHGWNSWSRMTLEDRFSNMGLDFDIEYWNPPMDVPHRPDSPLRSWTMDLADGSKLIANGSRMIHDFAFVTLKRGG